MTSDDIRKKLEPTIQPGYRGGHINLAISRSEAGVRAAQIVRRMIAAPVVNIEVSAAEELRDLITPPTRTRLQGVERRPLVLRFQPIVSRWGQIEVAVLADECAEGIVYIEVGP